MGVSRHCKPNAKFTIKGLAAWCLKDHVGIWFIGRNEKFIEWSSEFEIEKTLPNILHLLNFK